ncbi:archease [Candidatus Bathyarchaeota archaeon]|nr:MAG: archease [Candidatus Bathyarchaeota archaeon]
MKKFEYLEDEAIADLAVRSYGTSLEEAFENMALAMFNAMTPLEKIKPRVEREFEVSGRDLGELLYNFLEEFLFMKDVENLLFSKVEVKFNEDRTKLRARCRGEPFDLERHEARTEIKAITYHLMEIKKEGNLWSLRVVFDI